MIRRGVATYLLASYLLGYFVARGLKFHDPVMTGFVFLLAPAYPCMLVLFGIAYAIGWLLT